MLGSSFEKRKEQRKISDRQRHQLDWHFLPSKKSLDVTSGTLMTRKVSEDKEEKRILLPSLN
jgi:hypothetical protein